MPTAGSSKLVLDASAVVRIIEGAAERMPAYLVNHLEPVRTRLK